MRKASLQQQAVELIEQLSTEKLKAVIDYLNYLQDKEAWEATHELASNPEITKSLFEKSFWVKLFALKPSFFFKTRFLPQSRRASAIQRHIITIFSKPCQVNRRGLVSKPDGLGDPTPTLRCGSLWINKSTAPWDHPFLFKTGS